MRRARLSHLLAAGVCCWAMSVVAAPETAQALSYEQSEARAEFIALVRKARQGDTESQWLAGKTYVRLGDPARAVPLLLAAGTAGHQEAAMLLGALHEDGRGVPPNPERAKEWYRRAAQRGHASAMAALARLLLIDGQPDSVSEADALLRRSAELGDPEGQYQFALRLASASRGNADEALDWYLKSARQEHLGAQVAAATLLLSRKSDADRAAAAEWLERAAKEKDPVACFLLARLIGEQVSSDSTRIRELLKVAASTGHRDAQFFLGKRLADSAQLADKREAEEWLERASQNGHLDAANRLGELYLEPVAELRHYEKARRIFQRAAEQGNITAMYNLARMQSDGLGGEMDTRQALTWYSRAAEGGHEGASEVVETLLASSIKSSAIGFKGFWQK